MLTILLHAPNCERKNKERKINVYKKDKINLRIMLTNMGEFMLTNMLLVS